MSSIFGNLLGNLESMGFFDFVLPWLLAVAIVYGILTNLKRGADNAKQPFFPPRVNALTAIIVAFFFVNYTPYSMYITTFLTGIFGSFIILLTGVLLLVVLLDLGGLELKNLTGGNTTVLALVLFIILYLLFVGAGGMAIFGSGVNAIRISESMWAIIFVIIIMVAAVAFLTKKEGNG